MNRLTAALTAMTLAIAASPAAAGPSGAGAHAEPPALVVMIVVDQLSANLFNQHRDRFTGGFRTLIDQGRVYANGYHAHAATETCPGHATILTGVHPATAGIPGNDWHDADAGQKTYCLASDTATLAHVPEGGAPTDNGPVGPERLDASTLGDWLKAVSPDSRVFAVSGKDRGAITLAGRQGDGAFWLTDGFGFTTYVRPGETAEARLVPVAAFNAELRERMSGGELTWDYTSEQCRALEADWTISGRPFRSALPPARFAMDVSPILDEITLEGAVMLIDTRQLGQRGVTDVLGVSLSATDRIGHTFGSQGPEMCEQMLRLDAALGQFLERLEQLPGGVVVALTADHGGGDFPERWAAQGFTEARWGGYDLMTGVNAAMREQFGLDHDPLLFNSGFYVVDAEGRGMAEPRGAGIAAAAAAWLADQPMVAGAFTLSDILSEPMPPRGLSPQELSLRQRHRLNAVAGRSPDVLVSLDPGVTPGQGRPGSYVSGHGTPWDYDRRVPILFWTPGGDAQERVLPIQTIDIAPTLAAVIGVGAGDGVEGRCLELGWSAASACPSGR
ncbi:MAG: alkaline phosphatase family protein [Brevundimonas sp.]|uniref:alkaline phosphatase family protein n=1 Tax=Brevundimonas sp. TaxID=1871086 RepID=UPI003918D36F